MEQEFIYTIREDMGDHYEDIKTGHMFGKNEQDIRTQLEQIYGYNTDLVFMIKPCNK